MQRHAGLQEHGASSPGKNAVMRSASEETAGSRVTTASPRAYSSADLPEHQRSRWRRTPWRARPSTRCRSTQARGGCKSPGAPPRLSFSSASAREQIGWGRGHFLLPLDSATTEDRRLMSQDGQRKHGFAPADFFVLRTPLRPFSVLAAFGDDLGLAPAAAATGALDAVRHGAGNGQRPRPTARSPARARRRSSRARGTVFLASPSLDQSISAWLQDATLEERGQKVRARAVSGT